jgi:hypothetical protein
MKISSTGRMCSFCGREDANGTQFSGELGALICGECVERYHQILSGPAGPVSTVTADPWQDVSTEQLLATLPLISRSSAQTSDFLITSVGVLRSRKASWAKIGRSLGVSRQAAWERFHRNYDEAPVPVE